MTPKNNTRSIFLPTLAYKLRPSPSMVANKATPKISPHTFGMLSACSRYPELHCAIVHSLAPPINIAMTHNHKVLFFYISIAPDTRSGVSNSGTFDNRNSTDETNGIIAKTNPNHCHFSLPKRYRNIVLKITTPTTPHA